MMNSLIGFFIINKAFIIIIIVMFVRETTLDKYFLDKSPSIVL